KPTNNKPAKTAKAADKPETKFEDELMAAAEQLIVKGKEQGYLTPDDVLQGFPEIDAEPDQIFRIFAAFKEIGIEVTDGEKDFEESLQDVVRGQVALLLALDDQLLGDRHQLVFELVLRLVLRLATCFGR